MNEQLKIFFYDEQNRGHLDFEDFPEYNDWYSRTMSLFPDEELPEEIFQLLETANAISFVHGLKLGLRLKQWAAS